MQQLIESVGALSPEKRKALAILLGKQGVNLYGIAPVFRRGDAEPLLLSYAQERQWFLWQMEPHSAAYHIPTALRLRGALDLPALQASFAALIERHESLRTGFALDEQGKALQVIHAPFALALPVQDVQGIDEKALKALIQTEIAEPFDLLQGPLLRVRVLRLGAEEHVLVAVQHHIVSDGVSMQVMIDELIQLYAGRRRGQATALAPLPIQYADYALWQRSWMEAGERERQLAYWTERLGGEASVLELPLDHPRPASQSFRGASLDISLPVAISKGLQDVARREGVTLFMLLLASFQTLLHRYSGQNDIRVGVPIANRNRKETEGLIGFFVNTQVLRAELDEQMPFNQLLQQVKQHALGAQAHQDLPFEQLVEALAPTRSLSRSSLFQVMFNHQTAAAAEQPSVQMPGLSVEPVSWDSHTAPFDLTLDTYESAAGLSASLVYATDLFDAATITRMAAHWQSLLAAIVARSDQRIGELAMLGGDEFARLQQSNALVELDRLPVHERFARMAQAQPQALAVRCADQQLTFAELDAEANRLAQRLLLDGVGPEVRIGIALPRSPQMLVAMLAVLKAGGAYVPLDASYPRERLAYLMADSGIALLLSDSTLIDQLPLPQGLPSLCLDTLDTAEFADTAPAVAVHEHSLAYVIYTSGSTGQPKGVCVAHGPLAMHCQAIGQRYAMTADDCELHFMSFAFDGAHERWLTPLTHGSSLLLRDDSLWTAEQTYRAMQRHGVTVVAFPPAYLQQLAEFAEIAGNPPKVRIYCFGGDAVPNDSFERVRRALAPQHIINGYGPTETVVTPLLWKADRETRCGAAYAPIGERVGERSTWVLSAELNPLPQGVAGELYLGGYGVARGYLDRPALTAERFVPDPFGAPGARLYRSGDQVRLRADGVFDYQGRVDNQVKVRGFRIELGEIEARLMALDSVREAVVLAQDGANGAQLVGYIVAAQPVEAAQHGAWREQIRASLKHSLPDYMVPAYLMVLEHIPLTPNGKVDRKGLPKPDASLMQQDYVAPLTGLEQQTAQIWAEVLKLDRVGMTDNFFELGGHSLLVTQVLSRVRQTLQLDVPLKALFEHSTLGGFCGHLAQAANAAQQPPLVALERGAPLALSYAQERQWFLWHMDRHSSAYHIPSALRLHGPLDRQALQRSFDTLIARHESLRTRFLQEADGTRQLILAPFSLPIESRTLAADSDDAALKAQVEAEIRRPFDLQEEPLLRATLLQLSAEDHVLVLIQHHIVSDGWSMQLMVDELIRLYAAFSRGEQLSLPALPIQYADYAVWQRRWMEAGERERQLDYWLTQLGGEQPVLELPLDRPRPATQSLRGARFELALDAPLSEALNNVARREGVTLFMLLLASFQTLLHRYSAQDDIRVGVPVANRTRVETEGLIGFFVNTQVLRADIHGGLRFSELLQQVRQTALGAQDHQDLPFEQLVEMLQPERSLSRSPLFQVMFNHQAKARHSTALAELEGLQIREVDWDSLMAQFDLTLNTEESAEGIFASLVYAADLFDASTIARMAEHWQALLRSISAQPQQLIGELSMLAADERQHSIEDWNPAPQTWNPQQPLHRLIEAQAQRTPEAVAVTFGEQHLSYGELNRRANRLAHELIGRGVGADVLVGLAAERSLDMIVGLLAILKAGGAYLPLDPQYPADRLQYMIEDSGIRLLLSGAGVLDHVAIDAQVSHLPLGDDYAAQAQSDPQIALDTANLAYVIYTSGSTGKPKGTLLSHANALRLFEATEGWFNFGADDCWTLFHSYAFDFSVWEIFGALLHGGRLVIVPQDVSRSPQEFFALLCAERVTVLNQTPSAFKQLMQVACAAAPALQPSLRYVVFGGEALEVKSLRPWFERFGDRAPQLVNMYGITETTVHVSYRPLSLADLDNAAGSPLGAPIADLAWYVLDADLNPVARGCIGELHVAGAGLARGYLNRSDLSALRFVPNPFSAEGARLYRTGDLARYCTDGRIEYVGRIDHQVKIRGFRIELGEIEARLLALPEVRQAVVLDQPGVGGVQLVAYIVAAQAPDPLEQAAWREQVRLRLRQDLPDYMIPAHLLLLEQLPLTANGKLDRKALPMADANLLQHAYVAPVSDLEKQVAAIWGDVLKLDQVGLTDNFFELGGHSLLVINIVSRIQLELGMTLLPQTIFQYPVLADLVAQLQGNGEQVTASKLSLLEDLLDEMEDA
ncbi:amino acid adenylation domain-containing protein [Pseudomonas helmanticensis]|uniref:Amino acid adenylation domain-containing protein n=1 Tax=Pseudomonas helmanticensis TaxID=1471381 RepID=A0ACD2U4C6_9PSED|nr:non-ribosomal peptide synthetase [Pseudomonas helmanticensis]SMQ25052.1 amino acid adenylation domain-containing protein [Pseudomonas helmanticensis]